MVKFHGFQFDTQICDLHLESWKYSTKFLELLSTETSAFLKVENGWVENPVWTIVGNKTISGRHKIQSGTCFSFIVYRMILKRKPLYEIIHIILPSTIIGIAETVVFFLPCDDTTRVEISVTCLLAYAVFQSMIMDRIPKAIDSVPLLSLFIDLQMAYIGLVAIIGDAIVFSIINYDFHSGPPSPKLLQISSNIGKVIGLKANFSVTTETTVNVMPVVLANDSDLSLLKSIFNHWQLFTAKKLCRKQWLFIGQVLQRIILIIYVTLNICTPIALILEAYRIEDMSNLKTYETDC